MKEMLLPLLVAGLASIGACTAANRGGNAGPGVQSDPVARFHRLVERQDYYEAYLLLGNVQELLAGADEGAAGQEYQRLVSATAGTGQHDWVRILESPRVSLELKLDLVREIDEGTTRHRME